MTIISDSIAKIGFGYGSKSTAAVGFLNEAQSGRSGYWRLFYIQMQEEADLKDQEAKKTAEAKATEKIGGTLPPEPKKVAPRKLREPLEISEVAPARTPTLPPVKPEIQEEPNFMPEVWQLTLELRTMVAQYGQYRVQSVHQLDAANDEDDIELLLLVA